MMRGAWIVDQGAVDITSAFRVTRRLHEEQTPYQYLEIYDSARFGRMLLLDGAVQTTEGDEFSYHEMLAHPALCTHPAPRRLLIIGGGDGGVLEEVLKHPVDHVTLVEIDEAVVRASRQYLGTICGRAFDDPRTTLLIADGIAYVGETLERFDVVLVDSTDPEGPAAGLFDTAFYSRIAQKLTPDGLVAVQSGSPVYQPELIRAVRQQLRSCFPLVRTYLASVTTYPGVLWSFTIGALTRDPRLVSPEEIGHRIGHLRLQYYTPGGHRAAFDLPPYLQTQVEAG
jgi:spermidine synthase